MSTILVTGGAGFIGSHVCDALLKRGYKVICIDNLNSYYSQKIKISNIIHNLNNPNFTFLVKNIAYKEKVEEIFNNYYIDKIIHLAARAGVRPSIERPDLYQESNVQGTINLLETAKKHNIKDFVFASSSSVYGENHKIPFNEEDPVDNPISPYAASKRACELFCYTYHKLFDMNIFCLRYFTVYGPRGRPDMAPYKFVEAIENNLPINIYMNEDEFERGEMARDFTYINDIVEGTLSALDNCKGFEIINLGNGNPVKLNEFIKIIEELLGKKAIKNFVGKQKGDVPITYADILKARKLLNYYPKTSLRQGLKSFIDWYKKRG